MCGLKSPSDDVPKIISLLCPPFELPFMQALCGLLVYNSIFLLSQSLLRKVNVLWLSVLSFMSLLFKISFLILTISSWLDK